MRARLAARRSICCAGVVSMSDGGPGGARLCVVVIGMERQNRTGTTRAVERTPRRGADGRATHSSVHRVAAMLGSQQNLFASHAYYVNDVYRQRVHELTSASWVDGTSSSTLRRMADLGSAFWIDRIERSAEKA